MYRTLVSLSLVMLVALFCCAVSAPPAAALSFGPHLEHGTGASPFFVAVGDFNGDAKADLASTSLGMPTGTASILIGDGGGDFSLATGSPMTLGNQPAAVAVGYFNGDSIQDMAVLNWGDNNVSILLGDGTGGFTAAAGSPVATGTYPRSVAVGYFDGDAKADLAIANTGSANVTVLLGDGSGGFAAAAGSPFALASSPQSLTLADFDGDSKVDIATAGPGTAAVYVLLGDGSGGFAAAAASPFTTGASPIVVVAADFDGDLKADLATASVNGNTVSVLLNTTVGGVLSFAAKSDFFAGPQLSSMAICDLNGDDRTDLVTTSSGLYFLTAVHVLLNDGSGGMDVPLNFATGYNPLWVAVGDFNGGQQDLVTADNLAGLNSVSVLLNTTKSTIATVKPAKAKPGAKVTITGTGFGALRGKGKVYFGSKAATKYLLWSQTTIIVKVPSTAAGKKSLYVKTVEGKSNSRSFTVR